MEWGFIWLMLVLKIPLIALFVLVWWAWKAPEDVDEEPGDGGTKVPPHAPGRPRRRPRGPHGDPAPLPAPARSRKVRARSRRSTRQA